LIVRCNHSDARPHSINEMKLQSPFSLPSIKTPRKKIVTTRHTVSKRHDIINSYACTLKCLQQCVISSHFIHTFHSHNYSQHSSLSPLPLRLSAFLSLDKMSTMAETFANIYWSAATKMRSILPYCTTETYLQMTNKVLKLEHLSIFAHFASWITPFKWIEHFYSKK
jgi:hypothetical protein